MGRGFLLAVLCLLGSALDLKPHEGNSAQPFLQESSAPPYHLFNVVTQDSMIEKLNQYGATGYRFLAEAVAEGGAYTVIMEKAPSGTYQYVHALGTVHKSKFEESLNANGARGFRYIYGTMGYAGPSVGGFFSLSISSYPVCLGLMEKASGAEEAYEYKVVNPMRLGSFARDLADTAAAGFQPVEAVARVLGRGNNFVIVERSSRKPAQAAPVTSSYRLIGISQLKDREDKIAENAAEGYKILFTGYEPSVYRGQSDFFALLEKSPNAADAVHLNAERSVSREYRVLDADQEGVESPQAAAFVKQLNDVAASGYEPVDKPISRMFIIGRWGKPHFKFAAILQKSDRRLEYQLATADDTPGLTRRLGELWEQGFRVPPMGLLSNQSAIVERELTSTQTKAP